MADGDTSGGKSQSRSVLGDITNRIGKRGFSGTGKHEVIYNDFNVKDECKRARVSPPPCSEINSLKGNVISGLSKVTSVNGDPNLAGLESGYAVSKSSTGVYDDCVGGNDDIKKLFRGRNAVSPSVNELDIVGDDLGVSCDREEYSKDELNLADKDGGKVHKSHSSENKCFNLEHPDGKKVVDLMINGGGGEILSLESHNEEIDPNLLDFRWRGTNQSIDTEVKDELGDSFSADTSKTVSETGDDFLHNGKNCDTFEVNMNSGGTHSEISSHHNGVDDPNAENFVLSQSGSIDCTVLLQSQESRAFGIEGSTKLKEDECVNMSEATNSIRACSYSFCTKAAYIWLDLHQKDIKARTLALKKSQKDASILAERSCRIKADGAESITKVSTLESNLMHQWRALFKYMSNTWEEETNQLEANLLQLNNLREKCKADLELIRAKQSEKH